MLIKPVSEILAIANLQEPQLRALMPNEDNYKVLLFQPQGRLEVTGESLRNKDRDLAYKQYRTFLESAQETQPDVVVTPEYSMPWEVISVALQDGVAPANGKIWALGCESIKYPEIIALKENLAPITEVVCETLDMDQGKFVSPLAYVFKTISDNGTEKLVVLVQFKTHPMGDQNHFEIHGMQRGTWVYKFGGNAHIALVSLICADAFAFTDDHAREIHDRALIIHIQLNREPRHDQFTGCRQRLLRFRGDATEIICLNWAKNVIVSREGTPVCWENIAGSCWYIKSIDYDGRDATLNANHRKGFYYTHLESQRAHAIFFNYEPATYFVEATKVAHVGVAGSVSKRRGPQLIRTCIWDEVTNFWLEQHRVDDGFSKVVDLVGNAKDNLKRVADSNPFAAERIFALSSGNIGTSSDWHHFYCIDSCVIESSEIVHRITFCQDTHPKARNFRTARLRRLNGLFHILQTEELPPALSDFKGGFRLDWSLDFPHQNLISVDGQRATVVYMGEETDIPQVEETKKKIAEYLHRTSSNPDQSISAQQRLAVWYRENGNILLFDPHRYVKIDQTGESSEFDIARES